jgi:RNA polymerase subunit RPABC4/transcription elongation factor Spt4
MLTILEGITLNQVETVATFSSLAMIVIGGVTWIATSFITAPYGKFTTSKGWGFTIHPTISWMIMESPNLWMPFLILYLMPESIIKESWYSTGLFTPEGTVVPNAVFLIFFFWHYVHRDLVFPQFLAVGNPMPFAVMSFAFLYCSWNSFNQAITLFFVSKYPHDWLEQPQAILGMSLFVLGMLINIISDYSLIAQKKEAKKKGVQYIIPKGLFFEKVSCPNYSKKKFVFKWICLIYYYLCSG